jgi:hypothetical protein
MADYTRGRLFHRDSYCKLRTAVHNDYDVLVPRGALRQRTQQIHGNEFKGRPRREQLHILRFSGPALQTLGLTRGTS